MWIAKELQKCSVYKAHIGVECVQLVLKKLLRTLEKEKVEIEWELKEIEWRLDQEASVSRSQLIQDADIMLPLWVKAVSKAAEEREALGDSLAQVGPMGQMCVEFIADNLFLFFSCLMSHKLKLQVGSQQ